MVMARHRAPAGCQQAGRALQTRSAVPGAVSGPMWERLNAAARRAMVAALDAADDLGHGYIGDEHLLLALLSPGDAGEDSDSEFPAAARQFLNDHGLSL